MSKLFANRHESPFHIFGGFSASSPHANNLESIGAVFCAIRSEQQKTDFDPLCRNPKVTQDAGGSLLIAVAKLLTLQICPPQTDIAPCSPCGNSRLPGSLLCDEFPGVSVLVSDGGLSQPGPLENEFGRELAQGLGRELGLLTDLLEGLRESLFGDQKRFPDRIGVMQSLA